MATDENTDPAALRDKAAYARRLAAEINDGMAAKTLLREAKRYEDRAKQIESASSPKPGKPQSSE